MAAGTIQRTISLCRSALRALNADISMIELESLAMKVHKAMTMHARTFHTPEHIFDLADGSNPVQSLAALFHDVVYYQVDEGFTPEIFSTLAPYIQRRNGQLIVTSRMRSDDVGFTLTLAVFEYQVGQVLPANGQNEFLSALVMNKQLEGLVPDKELLKVTACIEATIPFRGRNAQGETPAEALERRLRTINEQRRLGMSLPEIQGAVEWAVDFSNRDVANFAEEDPARFLDNTWRLLPETNPSLRLKGIYSIWSYRQALQKMRAFLGMLNPEHIFNSYRGVPPEDQHRAMLAIAGRNVGIAREYLDMKLLAIAILEALADLTGGDAPVALFMGDLEGVSGEYTRLEDYLPVLPPLPVVDTSATLYRLLAVGRANQTNFDLKHSPLALFVYEQLPPTQISRLLDAAYELFDGRLSTADFLDLLPSHLIAIIAEAVANLATTRRNALREYAASKRRQT